MTGTDEDVPAIVHADPRNSGDSTPIILNCEYALLGSVLRADTVEQAASVLRAVADSDFADPKIRYAIGLARLVIGEGHVPAPSVLLARMTTEQGVHRYKLLALLLVDAWWAGPPPIVAWSLVLAVLEASYRRAVCRWASRLRQASEGPLDVLAQVVSDNTEVRAAARRLAAAGRATRLQAVDAAASRRTSSRADGHSTHPTWRARSA